MSTMHNNTRDLFLAATAIAAAVAVAAPARAAVIQVSSTAEQSPQYAVSGGGAARLTGTVTGEVSGARVPGYSATATLLPSLRLDVAGESADRVLSLDPLTLAVPATGALTFSLAVDLALDLTGVSALGILPDLRFAQGTNPFGSYSDLLRFSGTLSTGADAAGGAGSGSGGGTGGGAQDVPEPASFAALGVGLLGLVAVRRRAT